MAAMEKGSELTEFSFEISEIGPNDCLIKVHNCGVCYSDIHLISDDWKLSKYPLVPGHEIIGQIIEIGQEVENHKTGDRVGVGWQRMSCLTCKDCLAGNENYCQVNFQTTAGKHYGGFATYISVDSRFVFPIPKKLDSKNAAPLLCAGAAVYSGLRSAGMTSGQEIGVIGLGGLGHLAVQYASKLGNKVTVFEYVKERTELAYELGADNVVVTKDGLPKKLDYPLAILINTVNKRLDLRSYLRLLDTKGTLNLLASAPTIEIPYSSIVYQQKRIMGSVIAGRSQIAETLEIADRYNIEAYVEDYHLHEVNVAIEALKNAKLKYRAVITM
ncbi:MAG: NAD(P)-dependent alcohol dehydrogenase [Candidatus Heimdallarchaeota archaeon]|nr:NAD(P)-dependent alcohol dehydrogenase [Candidatus Heimdallarchaeota archaeon]